ncbi:MAG: cytidylate kinase-like family protein [Lachnospiraceae bacterium]|nr:cytidylate kinase-like family protein [Lachnospiraceae bacterium]
MEKQVIISISREYGSGGHDIAMRIAKELGVPMYDRSLLQEIADQMDMDVDELKQYDERPRNRLLTRTVGKHTNSMEEILIERQFEWIRDKAKSGESFIIVGRCAETVLREFPNLISIFITGDVDYKVKRIMEDRSLDEEKARSEQVRIDRKKRVYHNRYSDHKWGDSRYYDLVMNGSHLGVEGTAEEIIHYIRARIANM